LSPSARRSATAITGRSPRALGGRDHGRRTHPGVPAQPSDHAGRPVRAAQRAEPLVGALIGAGGGRGPGPHGAQRVGTGLLAAA
jgi:hypothetical protein